MSYFFFEDLSLLDYTLVDVIFLFLHFTQYEHIVSYPLIFFGFESGKLKKPSIPL